MKTIRTFTLCALCAAILAGCKKNGGEPEPQDNFTFEITSPSTILQGRDQEVSYTLTGDPATVSVGTAPAGWNITVNQTTKKVQIKAPAAGSPGSVVLTATGNAHGTAVTRTLTLNLTYPALYGTWYVNDEEVGVVIRAATSTLHGLALHKSQTPGDDGMQWSTSNSVTSATDTAYGMNNMMKIKAIAGWSTGFPSFKWCADLGEGWYLPAQDEVTPLSEQEYYINAALTELTDAVLLTSAYYQTSTEHSEPYYYAVDITTHDNAVGGAKTNCTPVRAVMAFGETVQ